MVRFIIIEMNFTINTKTKFTFQYGQIYYELKIKSMGGE